MSQANRYDLQQDGVLWSVMDRFAGQAASFGGENLIGLSQYQAQKFCQILNELDRPSGGGEDLFSRDLAIAKDR